ncbi:hypothetical protein I315_03986 [Cryptococcus gattii Ru294]|uniref:Unplaced genomic scaffold supercont1.5, whole genome shotgun sequence n=6 Tax=Cryptococcus gattii species complex TaxID=1884637 RepID=A0A0D0V1W9_9TREE|nr:hypothetical protein I309_01712 [Cryptococcus deuterogattii LA55]KIR34193.1 hypothetical protein I352_03430 [Cryptococcus deuterogattii MMRL2647]KIR41421.1 hypothetical protein I313_02548 [Cryptococcus deuterogattii Ram5]KIR44890.1 hypothetical protein I312_05863 [Cryptococcus bacillisporus CA1280]KIR53396.1 hypothetical protein I315_03986 [Cryptococcus gattii Ru294]KIR59222.1 hypothetical protein I314_04737 [Cryptococcus bacillisporus CA1873]KIR71663.1 hypothetical protein I310_04339 [Cry|eukprot:KIR59222.1 hypothetical protein I314_04737 [Cryptococcus gattii CA1873]
MPINIRPVVSQGLASCCTVFSIFGIIILVALGSLFSRRVEVLTGSVNDPADPDLVASTCYAAAVIYAIFVAFCGVQMAVHKRYPRGVQL